MPTITARQLSTLEVLSDTITLKTARHNLKRHGIPTYKEYWTHDYVDNESSPTLVVSQDGDHQIWVKNLLEDNNYRLVKNHRELEHVIQRYLELKEQNDHA